MVSFGIFIVLIGTIFTAYVTIFTNDMVSALIGAGIMLLGVIAAAMGRYQDNHPVKKPSRF